MPIQFDRSWIDEELSAFRDTVVRFAQKEVEPRDAEARARGYVDRKVWLSAGEAGLLCTDIPTKYGGGGGDFRHEAIVQEEFARRALTGMGVQAHGIAAHYLLNHGTEEQRRRYLPRMARGELIGAIAMSEPGTGSDLKGIRTRPTKSADRYVINGSKVFISNGYLAGLVVVVCNTDPSKGTRALSLLLVETHDCEGFRVGRIMDKLGWTAQDTAELFFDGVNVPEGNLLGGEEGRGFHQLMHDLAYERMGIGVTALAAMEGAYAATLAYVRERHAFGQPIGDFQNTKFKLAEVATEIKVGRTFVDRCIEELVAGRLDPTTAAMCKLWTSEAQGRVIDQCLQFFGGYGLMNEYLIARMYGDARGQRIWGGTNEIMKEVIARSM